MRKSVDIASAKQLTIMLNVRHMLFLAVPKSSKLHLWIATRP